MCFNHKDTRDYPTTGPATMSYFSHSQPKEILPKNSKWDQVMSAT